MWRVLLSVFATVFDGLMILVFAITIPQFLRPPTLYAPQHAALAVANAEHANQMGLIGAGFLIVGFGLNLVAIAFGARLRLRRTPDRSAVAAEFA